MKDKKITKKSNKRKHSEIENVPEDLETVPPTRNSDEPIEKKVCYSNRFLDFCLFLANL